MSHLVAPSYQVGWICAVRNQYVAACELLDDEFPTPHSLTTMTMPIHVVGSVTTMSLLPVFLRADMG